MYLIMLIALGVVLGVLLYRYLSGVLAIGMVLLGIGMALVCIGGAVLVSISIWHRPGLMACILGVIGCALISLVVQYLYDKYPSSADRIRSIILRILAWGSIVLLAIAIIALFVFSCYQQKSTSSVILGSVFLLILYLGVMVYRRRKINHNR